jgi:hypothetical protein
MNDGSRQMTVPAKYQDTVEPLVVRVPQARIMLGYGTDKVYELMRSGELEHFLDGRSRRITVASIKAHIERRLRAQESPATNSQLGAEARASRKRRLSAKRAASPEATR